MSASGIILGILALGFLIVVHESGHYFVARWCKMRVERFSVGFGPGILKHKAKSGTTFQLAPIPFGGFVEIRGMNLAEEVDPDDAAAYPNRPAWQRFLTILAGPVTNYVSAIFLAFALYTCEGMPGDTYYVGGTIEGLDAKGKLEPGDRIIAVDGKTMISPSKAALSEAINAKQGQPVTVSVLRGSVVVTKTLHPKLATDKAGKELLDDRNRRQYQIGVGLAPDIVDVSTATAARGAVRYPIEMTKAILGSLKDIFTGEGKADPGSVVRIVKEFDIAFSRSFADGIGLLMMLSVYLGLFNLFPLPALDGGRLVFLTYELVTRRRANPKIETMVHMGGIMVLMVVLILVTLHDFNLI